MRFRLIAALALLACAAIFAASASASSPAGGKIYIHATGNNGPDATIVIVGAVGDHGKTVQMDKNGKPDANGNFVRITLQKGTFMVDSTALNAAGRTARPAIQDQATCSFLGTVTAPVKIFDGTGLYKGISGRATITAAFGGIGPFYSSGPHKGRCNPHAQEIVQFGSVTGPGTVSFG
jgi:hypothetical protein